MDWSRTVLGRYGHVAIFTSLLEQMLLVYLSDALYHSGRGQGGWEPKRSEGCPEVYGRQEKKGREGDKFQRYREWGEIEKNFVI